MKALSLLLVATSAFVSGCAEDLASRKQAVTNLRRVNIEKDVLITGRFHYLGPETEPLVVVGGSPGVVFVPKRDRYVAGWLVSSESVLELMTDSGVDVGRTLREAFQEALRERQLFPEIVETDGEGAFRLVIQEYQLVSPSYPFGRKLIPSISAEVTLSRADGSILWQRRSSTTFRAKEMAAYEGREYIENPDLLRSGFERAAEVTVEDLLDHLEAWQR